MGLEVVVTAVLSLFGQFLRLSFFGLLALAGYHHDSIKRGFQESVHTIRCMIMVCRYLAPRIDATTSTTASLAEDISRNVVRISADSASDSVASAPDSASEAAKPPVVAVAPPPCWDALQKDLLQAIFKRLDSQKDAGNTRLVSKTWHESITENIRRLELPVMMPDEATQQLLTRLPGAFQCATHLVLHNNQTCHPDITRAALLQVAACSQIRALDLRDSQYWTTSWDLTCVSTLIHLTSLSLSFQVVERTSTQNAQGAAAPSVAAQCCAVSALTGLQQLRVWFMAADDEGQYLHGDFFRVLATLPALHTLTLNCALISDEEVRHILLIPALKSLTLYGSFLGPSAIEALTFCPHLKRLELSQNIDLDADAVDPNAAADAAAAWNIAAVGAAAAVAAAANAANIAAAAADAANNGAAGPVMAAATPAEGVRGSALTYLQLPLTPEALRLGPLVPQMTALKRLFVQEPLRHDAVRPFSQSLPHVTLPALHELFIDGFFAPDPSPLQALAHLTSLTSLTLCNSSLSSFSHITLLSTLTALEDFVLDLEDPTTPAPISDDLITKLASNWPRLISLHLDTHVPAPPAQDPTLPPPEVHLSAFSSLTTLQNLSIHHTGTAFLLLDCAALPPSTAALNTYGIILDEPYLLPSSLLHLRVSYCSLHPSDIYVISRHLTALKTLMVKKDSHNDPHPLITRANLPLLTALTSLQSLALSISGHQPVSVLSSLTSLTRLLLDQDGGEESGVHPNTWYSELMQLTTLTRLRSLWISGNFVDPQAPEEGGDDNLPPPWGGYDTLLRWQNQLQHFMPLCVLQLVENDRFWTSDIIMNEAVDWWACCAWPSYDFSEREQLL